MIIRIVKMTFDPAHLADFLEMFRSVNSSIRAFDGCMHLELLEHAKHENILYTYSFWKSSEHLAAYRKSSLFAGTWEQTKRYFCAPPEAWSMKPKIKVSE